MWLKHATFALFFCKFMNVDGIRNLRWKCAVHPHDREKNKSLKTFEELVHINDQAFLFFAWVTICSGTELPAAWYSGSQVVAQVRLIKEWMTHEATKTKEVKDGNAELVEHLRPLRKVVHCNDLSLFEERLVTQEEYTALRRKILADL